MEEKKVKFSGDASGLTSMFQKIKEEAKQVNKELIQDALKYSQASKDQVKFIEEQIQAIQRRNNLDFKGQTAEASSSYSAKMQAATSPRQRDNVETAYKEQTKRFAEEKKSDDLQIALLKDLVDTIKDNAKQDILDDRQGAVRKSAEIIAAVEKGDGSKYSEEERLKAYAIRDLSEKPEKEKKEKFLDALNWDKVISSIDNSLGLVVNAKSDEDIVKPAASMLGAAIGAAGGSLIDLATGAQFLGIGAGQTQMGPILSRFGEMLGARFGDAYNRHIQESQSLMINQNKLGAVTTGGNDAGASQFGMSRSEFLTYQEQMFRASYHPENLTNRSLLGLGLERGYGVDRSAIMGRFGVDTLTGKAGEEDILKTVAVLGKMGIISDKNNLPLEGFLRTQTQLISNFASTREKVDAGVVTKTILEFNKFGGGFSVSDPRSLQRIQNIHEGLTNPSNDFMQAANFSVLRKTLGPNASFLDIMKAQEQGLGGDQGMEFFKNYVDMIGSRGGSKENQILSLRQRFPGMSIEQAEAIMNGQGDIGNLNLAEMSGQQQSNMFNQITGRGAANVTEIEQQTAMISDAFAKGALDGIELVGELFVNKIVELLKGMIKSEITNMTSNITE